MTTPSKSSVDSAVLAQMERHLAELLVVSKKQLQALRQLNDDRAR